ncbi:MAG TPA: streptomycin biosynthesis protein StrI, partial [Phycisphaerales bacterium]|nr:streptomycin biosynthesis protein StrI [Phycisphaerales bacterium]
MTQSANRSNISRRQFLKQGGSLAAGAAVLGSLTPSAFAGADNTIRLALIGCGGRGNGAVGDALSVVGKGPVKLYAMADLMKTKMDSSHKALKKKF